MKEHLYRHMFLYAKGWYKRTNLMEDLRIIVGNYCGISPKHIFNFNILEAISQEVYPYMNENRFVSLIYLLVFISYTFEGRHKQSENTVCIDKVISELLKYLANAPVKNNIGKQILNLGKADYSLLPKGRI